MVRSASMHHTSDAIDFVPDLTHVPNFESLAGKGTAASDGDGEGGGGGGGGGEGGGDKGEAEEEGGAAEAGVVGADLSDETVAAARMLDRVTESMTDKFSEVGPDAHARDAHTRTLTHTRARTHTEHQLPARAGVHVPAGAVHRHPPAPQALSHDRAGADHVVL